MSNVHAAIGLAQVYNLKNILKKRKKIFEFYKKSFKLIPGIKLLNQTESSISNFWLNVIQN